jgi:phospholipase/carboxylesterase
MNNNLSPQLVDAGPELLAAGLIHRVAQPETPGPYPTAVLIHGRAANEDVMWVFRRTIPHEWLVVAPRAILPDSDGGYSWTVGVQGSGGAEEQGRVATSLTSNLQSPNSSVWPSLPLFDDAVAAVERFIQSLPALYSADLDRVVLMGFSQGAAVSFAVALRHPELVKGIASLVGFLPEGVSQSPSLPVSNLQSPISNLPIFMSVGKEDPTIPLEKAREAAEIVRAAGAELTYNEYDAGHKLNAQGMRDLATWWSERG